VAAHLRPYLPGHCAAALLQADGEAREAKTSHGFGAVASAPWGSASILVIPWMYNPDDGPDGLTAATKAAILNANYVAKRLETLFPVLYRGDSGLSPTSASSICGHGKNTGFDVEDAAKRLMDYGYHARPCHFRCRALS